MNRRRARHIRAGILDARRRRFPWWSPMGQRALAHPWPSPLRDSVAAQPRSQAYIQAYIRTAARMPLPKPPRGRSGVSRPQ